MRRVVWALRLVKISGCGSVEDVETELTVYASRRASSKEPKVYVWKVAHFPVRGKRSLPEEAWFRVFSAIHPLNMCCWCAASIAATAVSLVHTRASYKTCCVSPCPSSLGAGLVRLVQQDAQELFQMVMRLLGEEAAECLKNQDKSRRGAPEIGGAGGLQGLLDLAVKVGACLVLYRTANLSV